MISSVNVAKYGLVTFTEEILNGDFTFCAVKYALLEKEWPDLNSSCIDYLKTLRQRMYLESCATASLCVQFWWNLDRNICRMVSIAPACHNGRVSSDAKRIILFVATLPHFLFTLKLFRLFIFGLIFYSSRYDNILLKKSCAWYWYEIRNTPVRLPSSPMPCEEILVILEKLKRFRQEKLIIFKIWKPWYFFPPSQKFVTFFQQRYVRLGAFMSMFWYFNRKLWRNVS